MIALVEKTKDKARLGLENWAEHQRLARDPRCVEVMKIWEDVTDSDGKVIDTHLVRILPVMITDALEDLVRRYVSVFPEEVADFRAQIRADFAALRDEKGWSGNRSMRLAMRMPETLYRVIEARWPDFFTPGKIRRNMRRLSLGLPQLMVGSV